MTDRQRWSLSVLVLFPGIVLVSLYPTTAGYAAAVVSMLLALAIAVFDKRVSAITVLNHRKGIGEPLFRPSKGKTLSWLAMALPVSIWGMQWAGMIPESTGLSMETWSGWFFEHGESPLLFISGMIGILCRRSENG